MRRISIPGDRSVRWGTMTQVITGKPRTTRRVMFCAWHAPEGVRCFQLVGTEPVEAEWFLAWDCWGCREVLIDYGVLLHAD
jgi:hypothetical protein